MKHVSFTLLFVLCLVGTLLAVCHVRPNFIVKTLPTGPPSAGQTVTFQVGLNQAAVGSQAVSIDASDPSQFSSIPSTVYVANGQTTQTFQATLTSSASGSITIEASCNGYSAEEEVEVQDSHSPK